MKRIFLAAIMVLLVLSPIGCGHSSSSPSIFTSFIMSDPGVDGDIEVPPTPGTITRVSNGAQSVFAGVVPTFPNPEFRAFLDFPLGGTGGVPGNAIIDSAFLDIFIDSVTLQSGNTIPITIDLIDIQSSILISSDYDIAPIPNATKTVNFFQTDAGGHVIIDVTPLMRVAQNLGLANFRIRILEDLNATIPGIIEIDDTTATPIDRANFAPQLQVNYF